MSIKPKDLVTVTKGKPLWRALTADEIVEWTISPESRKKMPDGSPAQPPSGRLVSSNGATRFRVLLTNRVSYVFGYARTNCAVIQRRTNIWCCYMADLVRVSLDSPLNPNAPVDIPTDDIDLLLETVEADGKPLPVGRNEDDGFGQTALVPYTTAEIAELELERRERNARRFQLAMTEFGEMNLEVRKRVLEICRKYGLEDRWEGTLQVRITEGPK